jgi:glyoxylase-like metal-dependent hydrolase (beta-lactamase superfamily II)
MEDVTPYLRGAEAFGMAIHYVIDTHAHADHISGGRKLAKETGAKYVLHASAAASYDHLAACDEDIIELGNVTAKVLHTPEHISLLVTDTTRGPDPWFVCTGHTLMVGDMGRTELASSVEEGARALFESAQKLKSLPDYTEVLPGAFSGSVCGRSLSGKPMSTIGFERMFNDAFGMEDEEAFVRLMQADIPDPPADAATIRATNLGLSGPEA